MSEKYGNLIAGQWRQGHHMIENINPSDITDLIGLYAQGYDEYLHDAVEASKEAQIIWQATPIEQKQTVLDKIGRELMTRADELGQFLSREEGKPLAEGRGEVYRAGQFFTYYAAEIMCQFGENTTSVRAGIDIMIGREPMGSVAIISPWNLPLATASWKITPALAYGNAVLWKPANETPASAWSLAEIIARSDLPKEVFQLLMDRGSEIGAKLVAYPGVDAISFTGSRETGQKIARTAIASLTKIQLEMGSKNALLVQDEADMDMAIEVAYISGYSGSGQKCTASSRLVLQEKIHDPFSEKFADFLKTKSVGHALAPEMQMGSVINEKQLPANLDFVDQGIQSGVPLYYGGERLHFSHKGYYMTPALLTHSRNDMSINREEIFGSFVAPQKVASYEERLAIFNDMSYGLVAGLCTNSQSKARDFRYREQAGRVMINLPTAGTDYHVPFGGHKKSGYGSCEQGTYAREFYTQVKTSYSNTDTGF